MLCGLYALSFCGVAVSGKNRFYTQSFLLLASLGISLREILLSVEALHLELSDMEMTGSSRHSH